MAAHPFSPAEIESYTHPAVLEAGRILLRDPAAVTFMHGEGTEIVAVFGGPPRCIAAISRKYEDRMQFACTCGFGYGSACEHVAATMLAVNARHEAESPASEITEINGETAAAIATINPSPVPRLYLREQAGLLLVELRFAYPGCASEFSGRDRTRDQLIADNSGAIVWLQRSLTGEMHLSMKLKDSGLTAFSSGTYTPAGDPAEWVRGSLPSLVAAGFEIFGRESLVTGKTQDARPGMTLTLSCRPGGAVDCLVSASFEGTAATLGSIYEAIIAGKKYVKLSDGSAGMIPDEWVEKLSLVFALCEMRPRNDSLTLADRTGAALSLLESIADTTSWQGTAEAGRRLLRDCAGPARRTVPEAFCGSLRPYQKAGFEWFYFLQEFRLGGCLADDMGLGKTVQALALFLAEKERHASPRQSLLVVPTSLLFNWQREARKFAPALLVMTFHGTRRRQYRPGDFSLADLVITTYGTLQREISRFSGMPFNYVVLDEAQAIKNPLCGAAKAVRQLAARHRLALSGTPIENNLSELWSLFAFINPGMLGRYKRFVSAFGRPVEKDPAGSRGRLLRQIIGPCILRRTKEQVARELPPRTEVALRLPMPPRQRALYEMTRDACRRQVMAAIDGQGMDRARMTVLQALMRLRQICCHPLLVDPAYKGGSCKFDALEGLLETMAAGRHKVLLFSQFVTALDLLRGFLAERGIRHEYLTGRTIDRQKPVDNFQERPDIPVMLISLKAGGVGLNLTAADYVVLFDPWWNPAVESQAAGRAHRIGQKRPVFVYKLIVEDTVEERVLELQRTKKELFDSIITSDSSVSKKIGKEEIERLFS